MRFVTAWLLAVLLCAPWACHAQSHLIDTSIAAPGAVTLTARLQNVAICNPKLIARVGLNKDVEAYAAEAFYPGQTYGSIRARLLSNRGWALATGIYEYSTRAHKVYPYLISSYTTRRRVQPYLGALLFNPHFMEMHYGVFWPIRRVTLRLDYQSGYGKVADIWTLGASTRASRRLEVMPVLYVKRTANPRFYPGITITGHFR